MRLIIAGLFIIGGGLAALALVWLFYSTTGTPPTSTAPVISEEQAVPESEQTGLASAPGSTADKPASAAEDSTAEPSVPTAVLQIEVVRIGPDGSAVFAGRGSPEAEVQIFEQDRTLARTGVSASGEWVAIADEPLSPGNHLIIVELRTPDGQLVRADRAVVVELASSGEDKPLVALVPMTEQAEAELIQAPDELVSPPDDSGEAGSQTAPNSGALTAEVAALLVEPPVLRILTLSWADDDVLLIKGTSAGGQSVRGTLNETAFTARPEADSGNWAAEIDTGALTVRAARLLSHLLDEDEQVIASRRLEFDFAQLDIGRDGSEMVIIEKGDMLWRIAYRTYGDGIRYLDIVKRNQTRISDPDLIFPAQVFALPDQGQTDNDKENIQ